MRKFIILLIALCTVACNSPDKPHENKKKNIIKRPTFTVVTKTTITNHTDTVPKVTIPAGTIQIITEGKPDSTEKIYLLEACDANVDEVQPFEPKLSWQGLFCTKDTAYIKNTKLKFSREQSEIDEDGKVTGWRITSDNKDLGYFISGAGLIEGPINEVKITKKSIVPGEKEVFNYNNIIYTIYATGYYDAKNEDFSNYKLFLMANVKGHIFNQLLMSTPNLGDQMAIEGDEQIQISFIGDIDGDNIPDFILNRYGEFHGFIYLYLSKSAGDKAVLKDVAMFGNTD
jgi:hypothetical protein